MLFRRFIKLCSWGNIITDWSDQQYNGLAKVVGTKAVEEVVKGCRVSLYMYM